MKIPEIKRLVEEANLESLQKAAEYIEEEKSPEIEVKGSDAGEKLTHLYGAIWIKEEINKGKEFKTALREFSARVRNSIS